MQLLRAFDLDPEFGPCVGMTRKARWERAAANGLHPPAEVLALVQKHADDAAYAEALWHGQL